MAQHDPNHVTSQPSAGLSVTALSRRVPILRGFLRLIGILVGWDAQSSQEVAATYLMLLGFVIEFYILRQLVIDQILRDVDGLSPFLPMIELGLSVVIFFLLFHQFAIFRNFALPREAAHRRETAHAKQTVERAIEALTHGDNYHDAVAILQEHAQAPVQSQPRGLRHVEIVIYALFGVLTGEAGYMLTVLHEHDPYHWSAGVIWWLFDTRATGWGMTLECTFLACAMTICLFVLWWDFIVWRSAEARKDYGDSLKMFFVNDLLSLVFWGCLVFVIIPNARWMLGAHVDVVNPSKTDPGHCRYAWLVLFTCSSLYVYFLGKRFVAGLKTLAEEPSFSDARSKAI